MQDIKHLFKETPANLDWLDVDKLAYYAQEALPQDNYDTIPILEALWSDSPSNSNPERLPYFDQRDKHTPSPWEIPVEGAIGVEGTQALLDAFILSLMQKGKSPREIVSTLQDTVYPEILKVSKPRIASLLKEHYGLLGQVYVDAALTPDCASGRGKDKVASNFHYVKAKAHCADCFQNQNGRCVFFQKPLIASTQDLFTEEVWSKVKSANLDRDLTHLENTSLEKRIRLASQAPLRNNRQATEFPLVDAAAQGSLQQGGKEVSAKDIKAAKLNSLRLRVAKEMMRGKSFKDDLFKQAGLEDLAAQRGLLGHLYQDISWFATEKEAKAFLAQTKRTPFVVGSVGSFVPTMPDMHSKEVLEVLATRLCLQRRATLAEHFESTLQGLARRKTSTLLDVARLSYTKPLPPEYKIASSCPVHQRDGGMSFEESRVILAALPAEKLILRSRSIEPLITQVARQVQAGMSPNEFNRRVSSVDGRPLHPFVVHVGLAGVFYSLKEAKVASALPEVSYLDDPMTSPEVIAEIARSYAQKKHLTAGQERKTLSWLQALSSKDRRTFALKVAKMPQDVQVYDLPVFKSASDVVEGPEMSFEESQKVLATLTVERASTRDKDLIRKGSLAVWVNRQASSATLEAPPVSLVQLRSGRILRNALHKGARNLNRVLTHYLGDENKALELRPLVAALESQLGYYGQTYTVADHWTSCHEGKKLASHVTEVVKAAKCGDCSYQREGFCTLYQKTLVTAPTAYELKEEDNWTVAAYTRETDIVEGHYSATLDPSHYGNKSAVLAKVQSWLERGYSRQEIAYRTKEICHPSLYNDRDILSLVKTAAPAKKVADSVAAPTAQEQIDLYGLQDYQLEVTSSCPCEEGEDDLDISLSAGVYL